MTESHLKAILPSYPPAALPMAPSMQHQLGWAHIYLEYRTQALMGDKHFYPSDPSPSIVGDATRFVRSRWFYLILESVEWETDARGSH
jgi:hypothetical protein